MLAYKNPESQHHLETSIQQATQLLGLGSGKPPEAGGAFRGPGDCRWGPAGQDGADGGRQMFVLQMVGEMPGEDHHSGLTYKSHAETAAPLTPIRRGTHRQTHTAPKAGTGKRQPRSQACLACQLGHPSPGSFWKHAVFKELTFPPAHPSRDICVPTVFQMPMASPQALLLGLLVLAVTEGWGRQAAIPGCHLHREYLWEQRAGWEQRADGRLLREQATGTEGAFAEAPSTTRLSPSSLQRDSEK